MPVRRPRQNHSKDLDRHPALPLVLGGNQGAPRLLPDDLHIAAESPDTDDDDDDDIAHRYVDPDRLHKHLNWLKKYEWGQR